MSRKIGCILCLVMIYYSIEARSKPTCEPTEVCAVKEYYLNPCTCANNTVCGAKPGSVLIYKNVQYDFCQPVNFRQCAEGDVAWVTKGLSRQMVHCICPNPLRVMEGSWGMTSDIRKFKCVSPRRCDVNEKCMVRNKVFMGGNRVISSLKGLCECPENFDCEETGEIVKPKAYLEWEQEIWKCRSSNA